MSFTTYSPCSDDDYSLQTYNPPPLAIDLPYPLQNDSRDGSKELLQDVGAASHQDAPATALPEEKDHNQRGSPFFGVRHTNLRLQQAQDPFDYVHKYGEDAPHEEMGEKGRMWKTYLAESAKVDADKVANWTDALDVLLVFAGLFSAVVSTFVSQTFQTLQIDNSEVTSYLIFELVHLQRASMDGLPSSSVPHSPLSPYMTFRPTSTASWVNGLWFTSLALSLTTALIAVLTKQWIHEYRTSIELGTYRERGRIRQFRFTNLSEWHVPVIIGLLPVLMHVALGVFFAGLILLLLSLSRRITASISVVVAAALAAYLVTNVIPVFNPACPYKTPLTHYAYRITCLVRNTPSPKLLEGFSRLIDLRRLCSRTASPDKTANSPSPLDRTVDIASSSETLSNAPLSLVEAEKAIVQDISYIIDAQATVWLYGVSSNSSVQTIVLQAICNLPLKSIPFITRSIPAAFLERAIRNALDAPENEEASALAAYERLQRSLIRICPEKDLTWPPRQMRSLESLPQLLNHCESENAAAFLSRQILAPSARYDITVWVQILRNALVSGPEWLGMNDNSPVWRRFISWFISRRHACRRCTPHQDNYSCRVHSYAGRQQRSSIYIDFRLSVFENPSVNVSTTQPLTFKEAVTTFLLSSLSEFLLQIVRPNYNEVPVYAVVPRDILLRHVLIRLPSIQSTGFHDDYNTSSLVAQLIAGMKSDIDVRGQANHIRHPGVLHATFHTLTSVVSNAFGHDILPTSEKQRLLRPLFIALLLDANLSAQSREEYKCLTTNYRTWMTDLVAENIIQATFVEAVNVSQISPLISDLLQSAVHFGCTKLLPQIYEKLCSGHWLDVICTSHFGQTMHRPSFMVKTSHTFLAAAFVEGLDILKQMSASTYDQVMKYIRTPSNLLSLCKILMLSDVERRKGLQTLTPLISGELWESALQDLDAFIRTPAVRDSYECHRSHARHPYLKDCPFSYETYEQVLAAVSEFRFDLRKHPVPRKVASPRPRNKISLLIATLFSGRSGSAVRARGADEHEMA